MHVGQQTREDELEAYFQPSHLICGLALGSCTKLAVQNTKFMNNTWYTTSSHSNFITTLVVPGLSCAEMTVLIIVFDKK
jgi:hypothetical protein